ncbi:MAG: hypothetical protein ACYDBJ_29240 [Aggregatilineales bacterium]
MALLRRLFYSQLPPFARPDNPVMRHALVQSQRRQRPVWRGLRWLGILALMLGLVALGYEIATGFGTRPLLDIINPLDGAYQIVYWPLVVLQIGLRLAAIAATTGVIAAEARRGTWETLKITTEGASLALRTRCAAVFYQLRYLLAFLVLARVVFVIASLINFISFNGNYLDDMISGTTPLGTPEANPTVGVALAVFIAAMGMTASLILPFTALAFDSALGVLIGTWARSRWLGLLEQAAILLVRIGVSAAALWIGVLAIFGPAHLLFSSPLMANISPDGGPLTWIGAFFGVTEGDMGLTLLYQQNVQSLWADINFGVLIGVAALIYALLQFGLAQLMLQWAARRAARPERM